MPEQGAVRLNGHGGVEVQLVAEYLQDLRNAYNAILVFEVTLNRLHRSFRHSGYLPFADQFIPNLTPRLYRWRRAWPPTAREVASLVPISDQLVLTGVRLESPGFWEFLGKLNPLEVIRQYLNDRHERRKDRDYREDAEARRLALENFQRENSVIRERIQLARELGATDRDLAPFLNELVFRPLGRLDRHQDRGVIANVERAELPPPPRRDETEA